MHLLILSQENIELAAFEAASLLELGKYSVKGNLLTADISKTNIKKISRLAFTKKFYEVLFSCKVNSLDEALFRFDWQKIYKKNFCLRIHLVNNEKDNNILYEEADYAKYIWRSLVKKKISPKVDLDDSKTPIEIFIVNNDAIVCRFLWKNDEDFESRQAHLRPELHPTAMHPKMARALVNILNPKSYSRIIDPFCGAGGILIEAGLMNLRFKGYDIDKAMLNRANINLQHYKINRKLYSIEKRDATGLKSLKYVVTDLPYGKSSKRTDEIKVLYAKFLKNISGRSVIVFPDFVNYKKLLKENLKKKLGVEKIINHYVHKSLTRKIVVIDKK